MLLGERADFARTSTRVEWANALRPSSCKIAPCSGTSRCRLCGDGRRVPLAELLAPGDRPTPSLYDACLYTVDHCDELTRYIDDPRLPMVNNAFEIILFARRSLHARHVEIPEDAP